MTMPDLPADALRPDEDGGRFGLRWAADPVRFWRVAAVLLGAMAALKGVRWPSTWAETQAQVSYSHGFIKRGLLGTLYQPLHGNHDHALAAIFFVELAVFYGLLGVLTWRAQLEERIGDLSVAAVFASSYAVTFMAHLIGYNDIVNACLAMGLLLVRDWRRRFWAALAVVPVAVLVHESFLLAFFPVVLLSFVVEAGGLVAGRRRAAAYVGVLVVLAGVVTVVASSRGRISVAQAVAMQAETAARVDFVPRTDFYGVLRLSLRENVRQAVGSIGVAWWWILQGVSVAVLLPTLLMVVHFGRRLLGGARWRVKVAAGLAVVCPLGLNLLGWDVVRWNVLCVLAGWLALLVLATHRPMERLVLSSVERHLIVLAIAVNMASGGGLFDGVSVTPYPFFQGLLDRGRWGY
jgi:hypothetical protein